MEERRDIEYQDQIRSFGLRCGSMPSHLEKAKLWREFLAIVCDAVSGSDLAPVWEENREESGARYDKMIGERSDNLTHQE